MGVVCGRPPVHETIQAPVYQPSLVLTPPKISLLVRQYWGVSGPPVYQPSLVLTPPKSSLLVRRYWGVSGP